MTAMLRCLCCHCKGLPVLAMPCLMATVVEARAWKAEPQGSI